MIPSAASLQKELAEAIAQMFAGTYVPYEKRRARAIGAEAVRPAPPGKSGVSLLSVMLAKKGGGR